MSLYGDYIQEREGKHIVENEHGFATYTLIPEAKECYIMDVYVSPEKRKSGLAKQMVDEIQGIAKKQDYKYLTTTASPSTKNSTTSLNVILSCGFKLLRSEHDLIWFIKGVQ